MRGEDEVGSKVTPNIQGFFPEELPPSGESGRHWGGGDLALVWQRALQMGGKGVGGVA